MLIDSQAHESRARAPGRLEARLLDQDEVSI
jgi:hypothetical protein